jgi:hypothetical protein
MKWVFTNFVAIRTLPLSMRTVAPDAVILRGVLPGSVRGSLSTRENMADEDVQAELARLRAENETLRQKRNSAVSMKVSEKGAVSVYGLGRFPVTLYQEQWQKLLALAEEIKAFIEENRSKLKVKE